MLLESYAGTEQVLNVCFYFCVHTTHTKFFYTVHHAFGHPITQCPLRTRVRVLSDFMRMSVVRFSLFWNIIIVIVQLNIDTHLDLISMLAKTFINFDSSTKGISMQEVVTAFSFSKPVLPHLSVTTFSRTLLCPPTQ